MGWNGAGTVVRSDGTRTGSQVWQDARDAGVKVVADGHDTHDQDLADAIEECLNINGENAMAAALDMDDHQIQNLTSGTGLSHAVPIRQFQQAGPVWGGTAGGTANALTISLTPAITAYTAGMTVRFIVGTTNTDSPSININGVGAVDLADFDGTLLKAGALVADDLAVATCYDATEFRLWPRRTVLRTVVATTSGTTVEFTGIPANARRLTIMLNGVSGDGASDDLELVLGDLGGFETSGYSLGGSASVTGINTTTIAAAPSDAMLIAPTANASNVLHGTITLTLLDAATFTWVATWIIARNNLGIMNHGAGVKATSAVLSQVKLQWSAGAAFDAGAASILIET